MSKLSENARASIVREVAIEVWHQTAPENRRVDNHITRFVYLPELGWADLLEAVRLGHIGNAAERIAHQEALSRFRVRYWRQGRTGVHELVFTDEAQAEAFAAGNILYGRPCKVEPLDEPEPQLTLTLLGTARATRAARC